jgi:hypothetical protein
MTAAQEADTPGALAGAAWTLGMVQRPAGDTDGALTLAPVAAGLLEPRLEDADDEMRALQLHAATTAARAGREGDAWRHWDAASAAAERLASLSGAARGMLLRSIARALAGLVGHRVLTGGSERQRPLVSLMLARAA